MTTGGARSAAPASAVALPATRSDAVALILQLSDALDGMRAYADRQFRLGVALGRDQAAGYCATHFADVDDAFAAGQRATAADIDAGDSAFAAGWAACLDRFADALGRDVPTPHWQVKQGGVWTRHHPDCRLPHRGCPDKLGCLPGPRTDFGKRAPWDRPHDPAAMIARARASWGLT